VHFEASQDSKHLPMTLSNLHGTKPYQQLLRELSAPHDAHGGKTGNIPILKLLQLLL